MLVRLSLIRQTLERRLRDRPHGPLEIGPAGAEPIAAIASCWSAALTHAIAEGPHTLAELDRKVASLYGADIVLEHVEALVRTGQAEALRPESYGEARYALSDWGREAIAPLIAAAHHECHFPSDDVLAPEILDVEAAFQIAGPLLRLLPSLRGTCRPSVRLPDDKHLLAGATVEVREGRIASTSILLEQKPKTWATGSPVE